MKKSMKKFLLIVAAGILALSLTACGSEQNTDDESNAMGQKYTPEVSDVKVSYFSFCGNLHQFISADKGYAEEEGLNVEEVVIDSGADAFSALGAGQTDVLLTYSTITPLNFIAQGGDYTIFAGYMAQGATPLFTLEETPYNGYEDLVGKRIGITKNGGGTENMVLREELEKAGYDVDKDFEWVEFQGTMNAIEGVKNGEMDFAFAQTGYETVRQEYGMKDVWYPDDCVPMYSCCRVVCRTEWLQNNPNTVKAFLRSYMRAGVHFTDDDYVVSLMMDRLDQDEAKVKGYMLNPHWCANLDPLKNSVLHDWDLALHFGVIKNENNINIEDHINIDLYKEVLDDLLADYPDEQHYKDQLALFEEYNS